MRRNSFDLGRELWEQTIVEMTSAFLPRRRCDSLTPFLRQMQEGREWESFVTDGVLHMQTEIPGYDPKDVEVVIENGVLSVKGKRKVGDKDLTLSRTVRLREDLDIDNAHSSISLGILEVAIPFKAQKARRKVLVHSDAS